jgi:catechol 2,3-dioxygenase-like lactoylglutathione lyase family enzyme
MATNITGVRHVGMSAKDPIAMSKFYQDVMGMTVVAQTPSNSPMGTTVFLSLHPEVEGHHDIVLFSNPVFAHTAFRVEDLDEFLAFYHDVKEKGVNIKFTFNHGVWFSFYIDDPEGHNLEFYWPTNVNAPIDYQVQPIDLSLPKEQLLAIAGRMAAKYGRLDAKGNLTPPTNPNLELGNSWTGNPANTGQWASSQGNAGQWDQGGANQWSHNQGGTNRANPSHR